MRDKQGIYLVLAERMGGVRWLTSILAVTCCAARAKRTHWTPALELGTQRVSQSCGLLVSRPGIIAALAILSAFHLLQSTSSDQDGFLNGTQWLLFLVRLLEWSAFRSDASCFAPACFGRSYSDGFSSSLDPLMYPFISSIPSAHPQCGDLKSMGSSAHKVS
jgi:hypothetical protein